MGILENSQNFMKFAGISPISTYCSQPGSQRASQRASQPASQRSPSSAILIASDPHPRPQRSSTILVLRHTHPEPSIASSSATFILSYLHPQPSASASLQLGEVVSSHAHHQQSLSSAMPRRPPPGFVEHPGSV